MEKVEAELAFFFVEKVHALHFLLSVLLQTIAVSQSVCGILTAIVKYVLDHFAHFITKSHPLKNVAGNIEMRSILDINHSNLLCIGILLIKVKICGTHLFIET